MATIACSSWYNFLRKKLSAIPFMRRYEVNFLTILNKGGFMKRSHYLEIGALLIFVVAAMIFASCSQNPTDPRANNLQSISLDKRVTIPAYYDSTIFQITLKPLPAQADTATLYHNHSINTIYMREPGDTSSVDVLDAIQGDGFNPLWREVDIVFNEGFTPHQFYSDNQVLAAAAGDHPEIHLDFTNEMYICNVVGPK
jgi:hypothetical protein